MVLITHDQNIAEHADRILVLRDGRIFEDRTARPQLTPNRNCWPWREANNEDLADLQAIHGLARRNRLGRSW